MRYSSNTYLRRGDRERRRAKWRARGLFAGFCAALALLLMNREPDTALAQEDSTMALLGGDPATLRSELETARGELELATMQLERLKRITHFSTKYEIPAGLAEKIVDASQAEGIAPELAFRLVKIESDFKTRAQSPVGAVGLTQLMPATARHFSPGITRAKLMNPDTNLRIGFRYLRGLIKEYKGNVKLALLVYNRGPVAVQKARREGLNPSNGYDRVVTRGYKGTGLVED